MGTRDWETGEKHGRCWECGGHGCGACNDYPDDELSAAPVRWRKKPVVIEAMNWDGTLDGVIAVAKWVNGHDQADETGVWDDPTLMYEHSDGVVGRVVVNTLEGPLNVSPGDWIIRGVQGEVYPCKPDIFEATYDRENEED